MKTKNMHESLQIIKRVAHDFLWRANNGSIDCTHTYEEFIQQVKRISGEKGDAPTDPRHKNPAPPIVDENEEEPQEAPIGEGNNDTENAASEENQERREELLKLSMKELKEQCSERKEKMTGSKKDLAERLLQKRKPEILITRARRLQYVPKVPSCNAAIIVALYLHHEPGQH